MLWPLASDALDDVVDGRDVDAAGDDDDGCDDAYLLLLLPFYFNSVCNYNSARVSVCVCVQRMLRAMRCFVMRCAFACCCNFIIIIAMLLLCDFIRLLHFMLFGYFFPLRLRFLLACAAAFAILSLWQLLRSLLN